MSKALKKGDIVVLMQSYLHNNCWSSMPENYIYEIDRDSNDYSIEGRVTKDIHGSTGGWIVSTSNRSNPLPVVRKANVIEAFAYKLFDKPILTGTDQYLKSVIEEEIGRLYPIGSIVTPVNSNGDSTHENHIMKYNSFFVDYNSAWEKSDGGSNTHGGFLAYYNNVANTLYKASIVSKTKKEFTNYKELVMNRIPHSTLITLTKKIEFCGIQCKDIEFNTDFTEFNYLLREGYLFTTVSDELHESWKTLYEALPNEYIDHGSTTVEKPSVKVSNEPVKSNLDIAREKYQLDTKFICASDGQTYISEGTIYEGVGFDDCVLVVSGGLGRYVYYKKQWAEIITEETETTDFKEGDWVIGWHAVCNDWRDKPWQVGKTEYIGSSKNLTIRPLYHDNMYGTHDSDVKKLTKEEVLEWVKKEYPLDCKYRPINPGGKPYEDYYNPRVTDDYIIFDSTIDIGPGYVYYDGKWAEKKVQESVCETPKFTFADATDNPFTSLKIGDTLTNKVIIEWTRQGKNRIDLQHDREWTSDISQIIRSREITAFDYIKGKKAFQVSGTSFNIWFNAEGFEEFYLQHLHSSSKGLKPDTAIVDEVTNSKYKFKVGDLIVVTSEHPGSYARPGCIGVIDKIDDSRVPYRLRNVKDTNNEVIGDNAWCIDVRYATDTERFIYYNVETQEERVEYERVVAQYPVTKKQAYNLKDYIMSKYVIESPEDLLGL